MESPDFTIKRGDVGKTLSGQFLDGNLAAIDCSDNVGRAFWLRNYYSGVVIVAGANFDFTDPLLGKFRYIFSAGDLTAMTPSPRDDAWFKAEFKVSLANNVIVTFPTERDRPYLIVKFEDDLS